MPIGLTHYNIICNGRLDFDPTKSIDMKFSEGKSLYSHLEAAHYLVKLNFDRTAAAWSPAKKK